MVDWQELKHTAVEWITLRWKSSWLPLNLVRAFRVVLITQARADIYHRASFQPWCTTSTGHSWFQFSVGKNCSAFAWWCISQQEHHMGLIHPSYCRMIRASKDQSPRVMNGKYHNSLSSTSVTSRIAAAFPCYARRIRLSAGFLHSCSSHLSTGNICRRSRGGTAYKRYDLVSATRVAAQRAMSSLDISALGCLLWDDSDIKERILLMSIFLRSLGATRNRRWYWLQRAMSRGIALQPHLLHYEMGYNIHKWLFDSRK